MVKRKTLCYGARAETPASDPPQKIGEHLPSESPERGFARVDMGMARTGKEVTGIYRLNQDDGRVLGVPYRAATGWLEQITVDDTAAATDEELYEELRQDQAREANYVSGAPRIEQDYFKEHSIITYALPHAQDANDNEKVPRVLVMSDGPIDNFTTQAHMLGEGDGAIQTGFEPFIAQCLAGGMNSEQLSRALVEHSAKLASYNKDDYPRAKNDDCIVVAAINQPVE